MRENFALLVGTACVLVCMQFVRTELRSDAVEYDEEGFWIGHGLGSRKEGDEILKILYKSVGPFSEPQNVTLVEKFNAAEGESITFTQFNSSKVLTYFREVVLDFNPKNIYIKLNLYNITNLRLQRTVYGYRPNALKRRNLV